jgi:hypothetical protein
VDVVRRQLGENTRAAHLPQAPGGREAGMAFADRLRLAQIATSLGRTHTKPVTRRRRPIAD